MSIRVVVDSSSDLAPAQAAARGVTVVPLTVAFGDDTFQDRVDIQPAEFFARLSGAATLPRTSMPNVGQFTATYRRLIDEGATAILSAHVAATFSGTYNAARLAGEEVAAATGVPITVVDSGTVSAALGLPVARAGERVLAGASVAEAVALMRAMWASSHTYILLDTLTYLERGGRIGRAQAVVGAMLNIKPILTFKEGVVAPLERVRTRPKALARVRELLAGDAPLTDVAVVASDDDTEREMEELVRTVYDGPIMPFTFGPVVGTYAGPHSSGVFAVSAPR